MSTENAQPTNAHERMRIDAHHHLWKFDPVRESWITGEMAAIQKDFLPGHFQLVLQENGFDGSVVVQTDQSAKENEILLNYAAEHSFIKGIVGWIDLQQKNVEEDLNRYAGFSKIKGFRHILQGEKDRAFMLRPEFMSGISRLLKYAFTYDILIYADQLKFMPEFVSAFPNQKFVIDHIAKPGIRSKEINDWEKAMTELATHENVWCKISGMVTEADWKNWRQEDFVPYLDVIVQAFGPRRIMYGSDWPVCLLAASYERVLGIVTQYFSSFSEDEQLLFFGGNAIQFYNL